jgi:hypothetical protein
MPANLVGELAVTDPVKLEEYLVNVRPRCEKCRKLKTASHRNAGAILCDGSLAPRASLPMRARRRRHISGQLRSRNSAKGIRSNVTAFMLCLTPGTRIPARCIVARSCSLSALPPTADVRYVPLAKSGRAWIVLPRRVPHLWRF